MLQAQASVDARGHLLELSYAPLLLVRASLTTGGNKLTHSLKQRALGAAMQDCCPWPGDCQPR